MKIYSVLLLFITLPTFAYEFKSFKLKEPSTHNKSFRNGTSVSALTAIQAPNKSIYEEIEDLMNNSYKERGTNLTGSVLNYRNNYNLGNQNFSGVNWQKSMAGYNIGIDRQLAPDLFSDGWIVTDKFFIEVSAHGLLSKMRAENAIEISDGTLAAFAGMEFRRVYTYVHLAKTYQEGLTSDYSLLFLPFKRVSLREFKEMSPYDILSKEDYWANDIAAAAKIPLSHGLSFEAGLLARYKKLAKLTIQILGPGDPQKVGEKVRLSFEKSSGKEISAESTLAVDFFNLLKIKLFSYQLSYEWSENTTSFLSLFEGDIDYILEHKSERTEIEKMISLKTPDLNVLAPYVVSKEIRLSETLQSKYSLLLTGAIDKFQSEQVTIESDGNLTTFIKSYQTSVKYLQSFWGAFINSITQILFKTDLNTNYKASRTRKMTLEYDRSAIKKKNGEELYVTKSESLSLVFDHEYQVKSTTSKSEKKYKNFAEHFVNNFTALPPSISHAIGNKSLRGPIKISMRALVHADGITHLKNLNSRWLTDQFARICGYSGYTSSWGEAGTSDPTYDCYVSLSEKYRRFIDESRRSSDYSLWKLKDFLYYLNSYSDHRYDLSLLFGQGNIFYNGKIEAISSNGMPFISPYKEGTFRGLGVVDDFKIREGMRTPASITP